jgi:hypothetical protein
VRILRHPRIEPRLGQPALLQLAQPIPRGCYVTSNKTTGKCSTLTRKKTCSSLFLII